ncbi:MAG: FAD-dependent monooxygenase [Rhodospirillales bacterium]|nr:FAD-dependent monooxygenase [Rhodospirillales bacterium]
MADIETPVLVVGGGTVGLFLAVELGVKNVPFLLVDAKETTSTHPKGSTVNARSMEHLRRLGIAAELRRIGVPPDHPTDIVYLTRFNGYELGRIEMPSTNEKVGNPGPWGPTLLTPEPIHRCNQFYLEPVLRRHAEMHPASDLRFGWRMNEFEQGDGFVEAEIEEISTGETKVVRAGYMIGCDGGNGMIRRALGFKYSGRSSSGTDFYDGRMLSIYLRAPKVYDILTMPIGWHYLTINSDRRFDCISLDCQGEFVILAHIDKDAEIGDIDVRELFHTTIGADVDAEVVSVQEWWAGLALVLDHYQSDRILLAGDAVHLFTPSGGFGFNTGMDDAANLAWKLAAVHHGWGGAELLESYEAERQPIGVRNTTESGNLAEQIANLRIPPHIEEDSPEGNAERAEFAKEVDKFREEFASLGIQLGARYDGSPIIVDDGTTPPPDDPKDYVPSAAPGGRAPHYWIEERESLFDRFGPGFTLLRMGENPPPVEGFEKAAADRGIPMTVVDVTEPGLLALYEKPLALIRPDQHVAWRGDTEPDNPDQILDVVVGR